MALKSHLETSYGLTRNPFPGNATYGEDSQSVYVPEMFGDQRHEFLRKFVMAPLQNGQPLLGAVWSVVPGDPAARGFGKSTLMGEEAKRINADFGLSTLMALGVSEAEAREIRYWPPTYHSTRKRRAASVASTPRHSTWSDSYFAKRLLTKRRVSISDCSRWQRHAWLARGARSRATNPTRLSRQCEIGSVHLQLASTFGICSTNI